MSCDQQWDRESGYRLREGHVPAVVKRMASKVGVRSEGRAARSGGRKRSVGMRMLSSL